MDLTLVELRESYKDAGARYTLAKEAIEQAEEGADLDALKAEFEASEAEFVAGRDAYQDALKKHEDARKRFELQEKAKDADKLLSREDTPAKVKSEPLTYRKHGGNSFFRDMALAAKSDPSAQERLSRHRREMEIEREAKFDLNSTDATGGQLVAPLYLQEEFVDLARAGRVTANVLGPRSLPPNTDTILIPRLSSGVAVATQSSDNSGVQETDASFDNVQGDVKTIAGMQDVSRQLLDRSVPGVDEVIFADLVKAYAVLLDGQVLNSSTANNQGLLNVTGANSVTYTSATPTVAGLYPKLADAIQRIHTNVFMEPTAVFMHPVRWGWILASLDSQNRPLITPYAPQNAAGSFAGVVSEGLVGAIQGLPIYADPNIPTNLGGSTNEDRIIVASTPELFLYEESSGPFLETFPDVGSGNLTVRFRLHNYWAQINGRRPKAISIISGTGLAAPTF